MKLRLGTRGSELALWQAKYVANLLEQAGHQPVVEIISTRGDREANRPLDEIGGYGAFTNEIQLALLDGRVDAAVHSLKDLPTEEPEGLVLAAMPCRADPADAIVSRTGKRLLELPQGATIGTGSARRKAQLLRVREDLTILPIRGNVPTRIQKLDAGEFDAIVLAICGLARLGLTGRVSERLDPEKFLPAVGQGVLAVECRAANDPQSRSIREAIAILRNPELEIAIRAERAFLNSLQVGCIAPAGALATYDGETLALRVEILSPNGKEHIVATARGDGESPEEVGVGLAETLILQGARKLFEGH